MAKRKRKAWVLTIDDFLVYWEAPERYVLIESGSADSASIANADSLSTAMIDIPDHLRPELIARMRSAGVVALSTAQYRLALREDRGGRRMPQHIRGGGEQRAMKLVRLTDGRFHVFQPGSSSTMYCGFEHILAEQSLAELLVRHAPDDISMVRASIYDPVSGEHAETHYELIVRELIPREMANEAAWPPARAWHFDRRALFVCADVRDALVDSDAAISFSPGLFGWA